MKVTAICVEFTICMQPTKEAMDFYINNELGHQSEIIDLDIMEDPDGNTYYAYRCYGSMEGYTYWYKALNQYCSIYLGWD